MKQKTADIGRMGEALAADLLKSKKYKIIERNIHISHNEIDIIAINKKQKVIAFVEVKTRTTDNDLYSRFGSPADAVTKQKQERIIEAATRYLACNAKYVDYQPRMDVIEIYLEKDSCNVLNINHIENAFGV